jgi:hypothetical protein
MNWVSEWNDIKNSPVQFVIRSIGVVTSQYSDPEHQEAGQQTKQFHIARLGGSVMFDAITKRLFIA